MTPSDPPTGMVDRAYSVGGHATDPTAPSGELPDRTALIRALGIVQIVLGGICVLPTLGMAATMKAQPGVLIYGIAAANLLTTGIGSVRIRPWARRATLISSAIWLGIVGVGLVVLIGKLVTHRGLDLGRQPIIAVTAVVMAIFFLGLPITLISAFTRPSVRATFGRRRHS